MNENQNCQCGGTLKMIFSCSGASDVGEISDRAARALRDQKVGNMSCVAGIASNHEDILAYARSAAVNLVIDGCEVDCAKKIFDNAGLKNMQHLRLTDMGMEKKQSPVTHERITAVVDRAKEMMKR